MKRLFLILSAGLFFSCSDETTRFERLNSERTGIDFVNTVIENDSFNIMKYEYMYNGGGVGIADLNNDGLQDVILTGNKVSSRIYLNKGNFEFKDITSSFKGLTNAQWISGVSVIDINRDGWVDVYLTATASEDPEKRKNQLWINGGLDDNGNLSFTEMAEDYGIADTGYGIHAGWLDYDLDGDLDLYILNNTVNENVPTNYRDKIVDGSSVNNDKFYRNMGNGKFEDVTIEAGITIEGFGLGLAISDVNKDGYPDVYVGNDYISNDLFFINQGDGTFRNAISKYLSYQSKFSMGSDISDFNNDGNPDIITLDMMPREYFRKKQTINGNSYMFYINDEKYGYEHQYVRNMLQRHNGFIEGEMLPFSEIGQITGIFDTEWSWSPLFADFDNDGDRDLIVTNGFPRDLTDKDFTNYKARMYNYLATEKQVLEMVPVVKVSNFTFENEGKISFKDVTEQWGMKMPSFSTGAAFVDLDNDGDLDYVVNNINDEAYIFRNNTLGKLKEKKHYLKIKLEGSDENSMAIGSKVELWCNGNYQFYEHFLSRGYISSVEPVIHFGLPAATVDSLKIVWPRGEKQTLVVNVQADQLLVLNESEAIKYQPTNRPEKDLLFRESKNDTIDYTHRQRDFIDFFQYQNIIPHKFSQIGPAMAKGDINNDGLEDLVIGATDILPTRVYLRNESGFEAAEFEGLTKEKKCTEADLIVTDVDGDGDNDIVAVSGGYTNQDSEDYVHYLYRNNNDNTFTAEPLEIPPFPASVVRAFDYDGDGDADLFVGSRVERYFFPFAQHSYILTNEKGRFQISDEDTFDLGMVTDAVWSDFDNDGWKDLVITREWNSIIILKNNKGENFSPFQPAGFESRLGSWFSIAAGDFDNDGDDDYLIGNLGLNYRFNISEEYPMKLYALDMDNNGTLDPIRTAYWEDVNGIMQEYPVNYWDEMVAQSSYFRKRFKSYTEFSFATISDILTPDSVPESNKFMINTTSSYLLWNDKDSLTWEELPPELQLSPLKKMIVRDLNGDGNLDIIAAGNDHTFDVSTGYFNANKGIIMMGNRGREFTILSSSQSGLVLNGQVEGLLYFEGAVPKLVVGMNRDKVRVFNHNPKNEVKETSDLVFITE